MEVIEFQLSYFKSWKMTLWKCCTQYVSKFGKLCSQWPQDWKKSTFIPIPKKGNAKEFSNYHTIHPSHMLAKQCSKFSKPGFNSKWNENFQMFKLNLEKAEEPEVKYPTSGGSQKMQESSTKTSTSASLTTPKPLTVWITTNCGKLFKKMRIPDFLSCLLRNLYAG